MEINIESEAPVEKDAPEEDIQTPKQDDAPSQAPIEPLEPTPVSKRRVWTWVALGVGGAAGIGAAITGSMATRQRKELTGDCDGYACYGKTQAEFDKVKRLSLTTDVLFGVAAAGVITGITLFFVEPGFHKEKPVTVSPVVSSRFAGIAATGRF